MSDRLGVAYTDQTDMLNKNSKIQSVYPTFTRSCLHASVLHNTNIIFPYYTFSYNADLVSSLRVFRVNNKMVGNRMISLSFVHQGGNHKINKYHQNTRYRF